MILAETPDDRQEALDKLLPIQRSDLKAILKVMSPYPVTVRLLDPPIHEFLPLENELMDQLQDIRRLRQSVRNTQRLLESLRIVDSELHADYLSKREGLPIFFANLDVGMIDGAIHKKELMLQRARALRETNPMLGHRGVRLGLTFPEIYSMQIRAILEAAAECVKEGVEVHPEIMVPQVASMMELRFVRKYVQDIHKEVEESHGVKVNYKFGSMIEVVRACMTASELTEEAEFFSFGTNDLTQATFSFSREDAENKFLPLYQQMGILNENPFEALDVNGVGQLMLIAVQKGRKARPELKIGICGEHGGHPASIQFCHYAGLNYVSCSGPRVPIARLAAAHAALGEHSFDPTKQL